MRRRRRLLPGCLVLALAAIGGCGACVWWATQRGWTVAKLERSIRAEVPPSCDRRTAEAWFDKHHIQHWWSDETSLARAPQTPARFRDKDVGGMLEGVIEGPEANVDLISPGEISIYFFFDEQGRLVGHLVDKLIYM
jgi:hypothetical protein